MPFFARRRHPGHGTVAIPNGLACSEYHRGSAVAVCQVVDAPVISACLCVHIDRDMIVIPSSEPPPPQPQPQPEPQKQEQKQKEKQQQKQKQ